MRSVEQVRSHLVQTTGDNFTSDELREVLDEFCAARLMVSEDGSYLSLAIPKNPNW
jgi:hypothetical protein